MKKAILLLYLAVLYIAMAIVNEIVFLFGARPKLIKNKLLLGSIILTLICFGAKKTQAQYCYAGTVRNDNNKNTNSDTIPFVILELPAFPGGQDSCNKFIKDNLQYPINAKQNSIQGTVYVGFIVETDSSLTDIEVKRGVGYGCDEEAMRVIKMMPKWIPGKQSGKTVRLNYMLPIKFTIYN